MNSGDTRIPAIPGTWRNCEAGEAGEEGEAVAEVIEARLRTGRPLAAAEWIARHEAELGRQLMPAKRGPKPRQPGN